MPDDDGNSLSEPRNMDIIPRSALSNVCHSVRSEESALVYLGPELQILRFAQDDIRDPSD